MPPLHAQGSIIGEPIQRPRPRGWVNFQLGDLWLEMHLRSLLTIEANPATGESTLAISFANERVGSS